MKFFVSSDIHSAYTPWIEALNNAGFDVNNPEHKIILCGDLFDRMDESQKVYKFAKDMLEKDKLIYIKGNHESLLIDCCKRGYPMSHDISNGTAATIYDLGYGLEFDEMCKYTLVKVRPLFDKMINYFETQNHIFVHSFLPVINKDGLPAHYTRNRWFEFNPGWRNASQKDFDDAMWGNPFDMIDRGLNKTDKVLVFGHWATEFKWAQDEGRKEFGFRAKFDPYYGDGFIALDACTAYSGIVNCIVIEDDFMEENNE